MMNELTVVLSVLAATVASTAIGMAIRRRKAAAKPDRKPAGGKPPAKRPAGRPPPPGERPKPDDLKVTWTITVAGVDYGVLGPYRNDAGEIYAVSQETQSAWVESLGGRLPTAAEFDAIWRSAELQVPPHTYPDGIGPLDALNQDAIAAGGDMYENIAAGKTWIDSELGATVNYGWYVPKSEVAYDADLGAMAWKGIKVYPSTTGDDIYVIQPPGTAHGPTHVDYSQAGYGVVEL